MVSSNEALGNLHFSNTMLVLQVSPYKLSACWSVTYIQNPFKLTS